MVRPLDHTLDAPYVQEARQKLLYTGHLFSLGIVANSVASGGKSLILIDVASEDLHLRFNWSSTANMIVSAYSVESYTPVDPKVVPSNNNAKFEGIVPFNSEIFTDPTINIMTSSEALWSQLIPGGGGQFPSGGQGSPGQDQIIPVGKIRLYEMFNSDARPVSQGLGIICHETNVSSLDAPG